jgi:hypothetical protein
MIWRDQHSVGYALGALAVVVVGLVLAVAASEWYLRQCLRPLIVLLGWL